MSAQSRTFPVAATCMMVIGVIILCGLGTWQLYRLDWKQGILAELDHAYSGDEQSPLPLTAMRVGEPSFAYGSVRGEMLVDRAFLLGPRVLNKEIGMSLMIPLRLDEGGIILVNMGWSDQDLSTLQEAFGSAQSVRVTGLVRKPYWSSFMPENMPEQDQWYRPDLEEIAAAKGLNDVMGYILYAFDLGGVKAEVFPRNERWSPKNNHAQYAAFWFSMALVLIGIYYLRFFVAGKSDE